MMNESELNAVKGLMHYLNHAHTGEHDLAFDVQVVDSNGETIARIERQGENDYQLLFGRS